MSKVKVAAFGISLDGLNLPRLGFKVTEQKQGEGALHMVLKKE